MAPMLSANTGENRRPCRSEDTSVCTAPLQTQYSFWAHGRMHPLVLSCTYSMCWASEYCDCSHDWHELTSWLFVIRRQHWTRYSWRAASAEFILVNGHHCCSICWWRVKFSVSLAYKWTSWSHASIICPNKLIHSLFTLTDNRVSSPD